MSLVLFSLILRDFGGPHLGHLRMWDRASLSYCGGGHVECAKKKPTTRLENRALIGVLRDDDAASRFSRAARSVPGREAKVIKRSHKRLSTTGSDGRGHDCENKARLYDFYRFCIQK